MPVTLTIRDETASGEVYDERPLEFPSELITVRELIRTRVYQEVQDFNRKRDEQVFRGLVQPTDTERFLNGRRTEYRLKKHREIEWKPQFEKATGNRVRADYGNVGALTDRLAKGEAADVAIVTDAQIDQLQNQRKIAAGSRVDIASVGVGVFVRKNQE